MPVVHLLCHLCGRGVRLDRKSTRLNSSHPSISYAVFCLKKKNALFDVSLAINRRTLAPGFPLVIHSPLLPMSACPLSTVAHAPLCAHSVTAPCLNSVLAP